MAAHYPGALVAFPTSIVRNLRIVHMEPNSQTARVSVSGYPSQPAWCFIDHARQHCHPVRGILEFMRLVSQRHGFQAYLGGIKLNLIPVLATRHLYFGGLSTVVLT